MYIDKKNVFVSKGVFSDYNSKNSVVFVFVSVTKNYFQMHKNSNLESRFDGRGSTTLIQKQIASW